MFLALPMVLVDLAVAQIKLSSSAFTRILDSSSLAEPKGEPRERDNTKRKESKEKYSAVQMRFFFRNALASLVLHIFSLLFPFFLSHSPRIDVTAPRNKNKMI